VAERPKGPQNVNLAALVDPNIAFDFKTAESPEERASRLRREEAEDAHKRRISLIVHVFVMTIVALAPPDRDVGSGACPVNARPPGAGSTVRLREATDPRDVLVKITIIFY
jgi:hypothetical protein